MPCVDIKSSVGRGLIPRQVTPQEDVSRSLDRTSQVGPPAARAPSWWPGRRPRCQRRHAGSSGLHRNSETGTDSRSGRLSSTGPGLPKNDHELVSLLQRGLDVVTQAVAQGQEELQEIKLRSDMIMNAVVLLHQRPGLLSISPSLLPYRRGTQRPFEVLATKLRYQGMRLRMYNCGTCHDLRMCWNLTSRNIPS